MELLPAVLLLLSTATFTCGQAADGFRWSQPASAPRNFQNLPPSSLPRAERPSDRRSLFFPPPDRLSPTLKPLLVRPGELILSRPPPTPVPTKLLVEENPDEEILYEYYDEFYYDDENLTAPTGTSERAPSFTSPRAETTESHFSGNTGFRFTSRPSIIGFTGRPTAPTTTTTTRAPSRFRFSHNIDRHRERIERPLPSTQNAPSGSRKSVLADLIAKLQGQPDNHVGLTSNDLDSDREGRLLNKDKITHQIHSPKPLNDFRVTNSTASTFSVGSVASSHSIHPENRIPHVRKPPKFISTTQHTFTDEPFYDTTYIDDYDATTNSFLSRSEGKRKLDDTAPTENLPEGPTKSLSSLFENIQIAVDPSLLPPGYAVENITEEPEHQTSTSSSTTLKDFPQTTFETIFSSIPQDAVSSLLPSDYLPSTTSTSSKTSEKLPETTTEFKVPIVKVVDVAAFLPPGFKGDKKAEIKVIDPLSFLPPGYKPTPEAEVEAKIPGIPISTVDVSKFLPKDFKPSLVPEEEVEPPIPGIEVKTVDISAFLPPGFKSKSETSTISTTTEAGTTKRGPSGIVFPRRPNRPAYITTTTNGPPQRSKPALLKPKITNLFDRIKALGSTEYVVPVVTQSSIKVNANNDESKSSTTTTSTSTTTTTTTTTTTPRPRPTTPGICGSKCKLAASLRLVGGTEWQPELANRDTFEFQQLANDIEAELDSFFRSSSISLWYNFVEVDSFNRGSVIVSYILSLTNIDADVDTKDLKDQLNIDLERVAHSLGNYTVDPKGTDFIVIAEHQVYVPEDKDNFLIPEWLIAVIVIGLASFLFILIFGVVALVSRARTRKRTNVPLTQDYLNNLNVHGIDNYGPPNGLYDMDTMWNEKYQEKPPVKPPSSRGKGYNEEYNVNIYDSWRTDYSGPYTTSTANNSKRRAELEFDGKQFYKDDPYDF